MNGKQLLHRLRPLDWAAIGLFLVYVAAFSWMSIRQHESFQTNALDLAKFDQAIWNTAQGRPFRITLIQDSIVQSHFSPILAVYAPLYRLWSDVRLLFIIQPLCLGGAGFLLYLFFRDDAPWVGLTLFGAYLLHPSLHQVNLYEFRRITTAVLGSSLALYALFKQRYGLMVVGLAVALLSKENTAFLVIGVGLHLILAHRKIKIGLPVLATGAAWLILIPLVVLPALGTPQFLSKNTGYSLAGKYFSYLGHSPAEMVQTLLRDPGAPLAYALRRERLLAVLSLLWPTGFLFLLAPDVGALVLPFLGYLLASKSDSMGELTAWYPAIILPLLAWAGAVGVSRLKGRWITAASVLLAAASVGGYVTLSTVRPTQWAHMRRFEVSDHHRSVEAALRRIPSAAVVAAQDPLVPHLSQREEIYLFPWYPEALSPEYVILDREMRTYPVPRPTYRTLFYDFLAGTDYEIQDQTGSLFVFRHAGRVEPSTERSDQFGDSLTLQGFSTALARPGEAFGPLPTEVPAASTLRVSLFWRVDEPVGRNYTVFVHALDENGAVLDQHDSWPADSHRPTSVLTTGTVFRDVHYLTLPHRVPNGLTLRVGLYDGEETPLLTHEDHAFVTLSVPQ